jgi:hypothetical protein
MLHCVGFFSNAESENPPGLAATFLFASLGPHFRSFCGHIAAQLVDTNRGSSDFFLVNGIRGRAE